MRLILPKEYTKFFWAVFPLVLPMVSIYIFFYDWKFHLFYFNELEDFGSLLFALIISILQSALYTFFFWVIFKVVQKITLPIKK